MKAIRQQPVYWLLPIVLCLVAAWDLLTGEVSISWQQLLGQIPMDHIQHLAIYDIRMPRMLMAGICGALFAASGVILQTVMRNPLAAPDIVGVTAGAALMSVASLLIFPTITTMGIAWLASLGALLGFALTYFLARVHGHVSPTRLALTGVAIGASLLAAEHFLLLIAPMDIGPSLSFIAGTVYGMNWLRVDALLPIAILVLVMTLFLGKSLDLLVLHDETAVGIGVNVKRRRLVALFFAVLLAGIGVAGAGILGFVGLIAPQMTRLLVGHRHAIRLPIAMLIGACLVIAADTLGRAIAPPIEIPAGIVTTLIGTPYFLWLLIKKVDRV